MDGEVPEGDAGKHKDRGLPPPGERVLVRHAGREKMAYRDPAGLWRDWFNGDVLRGEVRIVDQPR